MVETFMIHALRRAFAACAPWASFTSAAAMAALLLPAMQAVAAPVAPSVVVPGFSDVKSMAGIDEYRLDSNGLTVLLIPDHSAPVVTFQVTYQVGSRNEG